RFAADVVMRIGLVERVEFGATLHGDETPCATKPRDTQPLRHVLAVVPFIVILLGFRNQVLPDRNDTLPRETHGRPIVTWPLTPRKHCNRSRHRISSDD